MDRLKLYWRIIKAIKPLLSPVKGWRFPVMDKEEERLIQNISDAAKGTRLGEIIHEIFINYYSISGTVASRDVSRFIFDRGIYPWPKDGGSPIDLLMDYCIKLEDKNAPF